jgi:hypothetical protein
MAAPMALNLSFMGRLLEGWKTGFVTAALLEGHAMSL